MVRSDGTSVLHQSPLRPGLDRVLGRTPNPLTPDDILESESTAVVHNPLSDRCSGGSRDLHTELASCFL